MKANACKLSCLFKSGLEFPTQWDRVHGPLSKTLEREKYCHFKKQSWWEPKAQRLKKNAFALCLISWVGANPEYFPTNTGKESGCAFIPPRNLSFRSCPSGCSSGRKEKRKREKKARQFVLLAEGGGGEGEEP